MSSDDTHFDVPRTKPSISITTKPLRTWFGGIVKIGGYSLFATIFSCFLAVSLCVAGELRLTQTATIELPVNARTLAWHPNSKTLAAGGWSGMLTVWDTQTGKLIRDLRQPNNATLGEIQYSADGKFLAVGKLRAGSKQAYLSILDASSFQVIDKLESPKMLEGERGNVSLESLSIDPITSKRIVLSGYTNGRDPVIFTSGNSPQKLIQLSPDARYLAVKVSFSPTGRIIAVGRQNGVIDLYSAENGQLVKSFSVFDDIWWIRALNFSPDGRYIFVASNTGAGREWLDRTTGKWTIHKNNEPIKMWDVQTQSLIRTFDTQGRGIESLEITTDNRYLIAGLTKGFVAIWDVKTGAEIKRFRPSANSTIVKLSPDGKQFATSDTGSKKVKIWMINEQ
ncbi:MAG: Protein kinase:G-protein beta repeat [Proteobacteria bacterium]|nr:Protein kinase:G-protein beta repeat [Pseudomonadota bacterium]